MELVAEKYKQTEVGLIPSDWEVKEFGELAEKIIGGGTPSRSNKLFWGNEIPWVTVKDFATFNSSQTQEYITKDGLNNSASHLIPKGIIITSTRMALGKAVIYDVDVSINQDLKAIFPKKNIDTKFFFYWFQFNSKYIEDLGSGSTVMGLSLPDLRKIKVKLPPTKTEQTAIATALSDADALINGLEKLITKKRNIKQGAMQKLLQPKEGWEVKKLGEILGKVTTGKLDANAMKENGEYRFYTCAKDYYFIDEYAFDTEALLVSGNGANVGYIHYYKGKFNAYQRTYVLTDFSIDVFYIKLFLDSYLKERITTEVSAGNTPYIKMDTITDMIIHYPTNPDEQTRIATILSDMDAEITALETKLEKYRKVKLGMMQNLLTGKIRLV